MLAINHATLATAAALGASYYLNLPFFLPLIIFVVFAGVAPDIDHPGSELGQMFKPLARMLPHRGVTHSVLGTAVFAGILYFLLGLDNQYFNYFLIFAALFGVYLLNKIVSLHINSLDNLTRNLVSKKQVRLLLTIGSAIIYLFLFSLIFVIWNPALKLQVLHLLILGYFLHIVGDFVTIEGVPLFFPIKKKIGLKLFRTGSKTESVIGIFLAILNVYLLYKLNQKYDYLSLGYWQSNLSF